MSILRVFCSVVGAMSCLSATANAAGVLDVGLVFPRENETYEPTEEFPIVWAFQNARVAELLETRLEYRLGLRKTDTTAPQSIATDVFQRHLNVSDFSDEASRLGLYWAHVNLTVEGPIGMGWNVLWSECQNLSSSPFIDYSRNRTSIFLVDFEVRKGGKKADLVAATAANDQECPDRGFALRVTDKTLAVNSIKPFQTPPNRTCAIVDSSSPTPTANPCRVKIDQAVLASMEARTFESKCRMPWNKPANCPQPDTGHARREIAAVSIVVFAAVYGALYLLV